MTYIFWDIDDTLYNQFIPFRDAFKVVFDVQDIEIQDVFIESRKLSDSVYDLTERGLMSKSDMQIFRIKKSLEKYKFFIDDSQALNFQKEYQFQQSKIVLSNQIVKTLDYLFNKQINLGIISNGPSLHQRNKIKSLGLNKWIPDKNIFISSELSFSKPNIEIFKLAEKNVHKNFSEEVYLIGDSYNNDVIGAINAGWKSIWFNKHSRIVENNNFIPNYIVKSDVELFNLIISKF